MNDMPRVAAATTAEWHDLVDELDQWGSVGRLAEFWWRDDDAVTLTPQLENLLHLAAGVPIALAVIPSVARTELADALRGRRQVTVLQHGWRHANWGADGKKSEYPPGRPDSVVAAELRNGRERLRAIFGAGALPVMVPPWNRIADEFLPLLAASGFAALSTMASPHTPAVPPGLRAIDVHVDLVGWRGDRGFVGAGPALGGLIRSLRAQRRGAAAGPVGILTHHLILDDPAAAFLERLIGLVSSHPAARWTAIGELLQ